MELISKNDLIRYIKCWCIGEGIGHDQKTFLRAIQDQEIVEVVPLSMIDDIKAEIDHDLKNAPYWYDEEHLEELGGFQDGLEHALEIIDKHIGKESHEKETC